jgi:4-alpha-glucanotransferase
MSEEKQELFPRSSGVLLHPTSLPGRYGVGDLGEYAYRFVDWLHEAGQTVWQILPLGPTSYGDSPYQTLSALAGNMYLISLDRLVGEGWLTNDDVADVPDFPTENVDFGWVITYHLDMLDKAWVGFKARSTDGQRQALDAWAANTSWLEDWALFIALKNDHGGRPWTEWETDLIKRKPAALKQARERLADEIAKHKFLQWVFAVQWGDVKRYANERGIRLIGDVPIFVAHDSSDVWANQKHFYLDDLGNPTVVAGVPPDYFSVTGQRWGNPLYRWDAMEKDGYKWWIQRFQVILEQVDLIRIDHFRGFEAYWEIPASEPTAVKGRWLKGPNVKFFYALRDALGELPIIAEDLGVIVKEVVELRDTLNLPGMKVLQFAWSKPENPFLPHNHVPNNVVYIGTHDNNTTLGWWQQEVDENTRNFMQSYLNREITDPVWTLIQLGMGSVGKTFVATMQDLLGMGPEGRMNTPGQPSGNWSWRMTLDQLNDVNPRHRLSHITWLYRRKPDQQAEQYGDVATDNMD